MSERPIWERSDLWDRVEPPPPGGLLVDSQLRPLVGEVFWADNGRGVQIAEASIDLHVRSAEKFTAEPDEVVRFGEGEALTMRQGEILRVETWEHFEIPADMAGQISPKARGLVAGLLLPTTQIDPGFSGPLLLLLINAGPRAVRLPPNFALAKTELRRLGRPADKPWKGQAKSRMQHGYAEEPKTLFVDEPARPTPQAAPAAVPAEPAPDHGRLRTLAWALLAEAVAILVLGVEVLVGWGDVVDAIGDIDVKELAYGVAAGLVVLMLTWLGRFLWRRARSE